MCSVPNNLSSFKSFDSFNTFIFSRTSDNKPYFLLRENPTSQDYIHVHGQFAQNEPSVIVAAALEVRKITNGLFCPPNHKYFSYNIANIVDPTEILLEKHPRSKKPMLTLTPTVDSICQQICESPFYFQDASNTATYFIEVPMMDLEAVHTFAETKGLDYKFRYFSFEEICGKRSELVSRELKETIVKNPDLVSYIHEYIVSKKSIEITASYGIICCEMFSKTHILHGLHFPVFKKHGESWRFYKAYEKDLPTEEEMERLDGLIIPGSSCSASNPYIDWYQGLFSLIRKVSMQYSNIKLLGICFGAQIIAQALGGRVEKMPGGFVNGGECLKINPDFFELPYVKKSNLDAAKQLVIAQAHNDHIVELPPNAKHYASSNSCNVEIFTVNDNILAFQGHPDYNEVMVCRGAYKRDSLGFRNYSSFEEHYMKTKFQNGLTQEEILKICFNFLKG